MGKEMRALHSHAYVLLLCFFYTVPSLTRTYARTVNYNRVRFLEGPYLTPSCSAPLVACTLDVSFIRWRRDPPTKAFYLSSLFRMLLPCHQGFCPTVYGQRKSSTRLAHRFPIPPMMLHLTQHAPLQHRKLILFVPLSTPRQATNTSIRGHGTKAIRSERCR
jgi:hypothetical protein